MWNLHIQMYQNGFKQIIRSQRSALKIKAGVITTIIIGQDHVMNGSNAIMTLLSINHHDK